MIFLKLVPELSTYNKPAPIHLCKFPCKRIVCFSTQRKSFVKKVLTNMAEIFCSPEVHVLLPRKVNVATIEFKMENDDVPCDNNLTEINSGSEFGENDDNNLDGNPSLADALGKVLRMAQKKTKNKSIVLSKAKLHRINKQVRKETCGFEIEPNPNTEVIKQEEEENVKPDIKVIKKTVKSGLTRHEKLKRGRIIPSILDKEKEKQLAKIATRGVVQLFNAVKQQQSLINKQLKETKLPETKREKILKSIDRKGFLDALSSCGNVSLKMDVPEDKMQNDIKEEDPCDDSGNEEKLSWEVLRSDFMMGAKLKDWDKKEDDELSN